MFANNGYGQQQLPFSAEQVQGQLLNIVLGQPPYCPNYIPGPPFDGNAMAFVASIAALELQNKHATNPARLYMFNMYAVNNYANDDFSKLVVDSADYMMLELNNYRTLEDAAGNLVPQMVEMHCAIVVLGTRGLERYIDQQTGQAIEQAADVYKQIMRHIENAKFNSQPRAGYGGQMNTNRGGYGGGSNSRFGGGNNARYDTSPRAGYGGQQPTNNNQGQRQGNSGLFVREEAQQQGAGRSFSQPQRTQQQVQPNQNNNPLQQPFQKRETQQMTTAATAAIEPEVEKELITRSDWVSSINQRYLRAFNPVTHTEAFERNKAGNIIQTIDIRETPIMDYEKHGIQTVFGTMPAGTDPQASASLRAFKQKSTEVDDVAAAARQAIVLCEDDVRIVEVSEASAFLTAELKRTIAIAGTEQFNVFRAHAYIAEPSVHTADEVSTVSAFGQNDTLMQLRDMMRDCKKDVSAGLWSIADQRMTRCINRVLSQNLSTTLNITSFYDDIEDLLTLLETEEFGPVIAAAFRKYQKKYIQSTFGVLDDDLATGLVDLYLDTEELASNKVVITFVSSLCSLTLLDCTAHQLEIQLADKTGAVIYPDDMPYLFEIAESLFTDIESSPDIYDRHLIKTSDSRVLELTKGHVGQDCYLLTLVK